jgi:hypothetical protein
MKKDYPILFIYPKDVQLFTRKTLRHAALLIQKIQASLGKQSHQPLTVSEFCHYMKLEEDLVYRMLGYR